MKKTALCALLLAAGCSMHRAQSDPQQPVAPAPATVAASWGTLRPVLTLSGIVAPYQNVQITSSLAEPADEVRVHNGDRVRKGDVLAVLDSADIRANLETAARNAESAAAKTAQTRYQASLSIAQGQNSVEQQRAALVQAQQTLLEDRKDLARDKELLTQQFISQQEYDQQRTRVANDAQSVVNAQAALRSAVANRDINGTQAGGLQAANVAAAASEAAADRATILQYQAQLDKTVIRSPVDGVVTQRTLNPGEYPGARTLFVVQQLDPVYTDLNASTSQTFAVQSGSVASVVVAGTDVKTQGVVTAVLGQTQPGSTNFTVEVRVPNPSLQLKSGMPVTASLREPDLRGMIVPLSAFTNGLHDHVIVLDGTNARFMKVTALGVSGDRAVVTGLRPGVRVVRNGSDGVAALMAAQ